MKILQIHSSDREGGGGGTVAMERLDEGLRSRGLQSRIMAGRKTTRSEHSQAIPRGNLMRKLESAVGLATRELGLNDLNHLSSFRVTNTDFYREADLLHIHGTHGFFNYLALPQLTKDKPAVFTLHDMWPLTGHCAYSIDCERWASGCGACPHLDVHPAAKRDNTRLEWKLKRWAYGKSRLTFVAVSRWLEDMTRRGLLSDQPVHFIPNGVDTRTYEPIDPHWCRTALGIQDSRFVILFVALSLNDQRKGGDVVAKALGNLPDAMKRETCLVVFGSGGEQLARELGIRTVDLGFVRNDRLKAIAYSSADVFLCPTRYDNAPLVLQESMACGTPMLASNVGGVPDFVRDEVTGRLTPAGDSQAFSVKLQGMLEDAPARQRMSQACREIAVAEYDLQLSLDRHIDLYRRVLGLGTAHTTRAPR